MAVPGRVRQRQVEQRRQPVGDFKPALAERRERASGAAELQRQRLLTQPPQPLARARQRRPVAGELEPERHRQCMLQFGARDRGRAAVAPGERGEGLDGAVELGNQRVDRGAKFEHLGGVDDVLGGGAPVHIAGGCGIGLGDFGGERLDQRARDVAGADSLLAEPSEVVAVGRAGRGNRIDRRGRNDTDGRLGAGERHFEIEHALHARPIIEDQTHGFARHERGQQRGGDERIGHGGAPTQ